MTSPLLSAVTGCALLALLVPRSLADDLAVAGIRDVAHFEQLRAETLLTTSDGWRIQLGLGEGGSGSGPWRLLYCLATRTEKPVAAAHQRKEYGEVLGPVFFRVTQDAQPGLNELANVQFARLPNEALYCAAIPVAWSGEYHIQVFARAGTLLARRTLVVDKPVPCYWQPFAELRRRSDLHSTPYVTRNIAVAATISFDGALVWKRNGHLEMAHHAGKIPLPGRVPSHPSWWGGEQQAQENRRRDDAATALRLSLKDSVFVVDSPVRLIDWPDLHLLARWWVNDRAIVPSRSDEIKAISLGRQVTFTKRMHVNFGLPAVLGDLNEGDKIGLQVLFTPGMHKQLPASRFSDGLEQLAAQTSKAASIPLLSNRLEVVVTREMLADRL